MSLILDALRKSEAERRRGQAPGLYAELPPLQPYSAPARRSWPWWLAAGLAAFVALWLLRGAWTAPQAPTVQAAPAQAAPAPAALASAPTPRMTAPARIAPPPAVAPTTSPPRQPAGTAASASAPPPRPAPQQPPSEPAGSPAPPTLAEAAVSAVELPAAAPAEPVAVATAPAVPSSTPSSALRLADLSAGEREQLPALKISMHMWGPTADQRFAIIDGARVGQGDRVGDAVVEEIAADSVVLNWHGRRVALPIH